MSNDEANKPGHYYRSINIFDGNVVLGNVFGSIPTSLQISEDDGATRAISSAEGTNDTDALRLLLDRRRPLLLTFLISILGSFAVKENLIIVQHSMATVLEATSGIYLVAYDHF